MVATITLTSRAFQPGGAIPRRYTKDGQNISLPLQWDGVPREAQELALIVDDPDAPGGEPFAHWLVYHIPPKLGGLPEGSPGATGPALQPGVEEGRNSFGTRGYGGRAPPSGETHHYHVRLLALDSPLDVEPGADRSAVLEAAKGHVLPEGELVGMYGR